MSRICCGEPQKTNLTKNEYENGPFKGAPIGKMQSAPLTHSKRTSGEPKTVAGNKNLDSVENNSPDQWRSRAKLKFHCHHEERKRKAEMRRKKLIQKIKRNYEISVDGFNENVTNEIIRKVESIERENRERERKQLERTLYMITRLLEEQKAKKRASNLSSRTWRRKTKSLLPCLSEGPKTKCDVEAQDVRDKRHVTSKADLREEEVLDPVTQANSAEQQQQIEKEVGNFVFDQNEVEEEETEGLSRESEFSSTYESSLSSSESVPLEKCLKPTPKRIVFQNYRSGEVYLQVLKITNISLETIHCRYLGIVVHVKQEDRFPIGVAVRDSVKLRPGLSCSTKIRLCSKDDSKELECSIVYETRRQNKPFRHSFFFVPVVCIPARAIVRVSPTKIRFPCLTWCAATGLEGNQTLKKIIKIENSGGRECTCKIYKGTIKKPEEEEEEEEEEDIVFGGRRPRKSTNTQPTVTDDDATLLCEEESEQDDCQDVQKQALNLAQELMEELTNNVFLTFRFAEKYYVTIPPFSTKQIEVRFIPEYKGFHQETHVIQFDGCHNSSEEVIELSGDIKKLPLTAEPQLIDLKICTMNSGVYAAMFKVFNTSKGPYSVCLKLPRSLKNHANVYPKGTIIQANSSCEFSVRLYPRLSLSQDVGRYFNEDSGVLEFPVFIHPGKASSTCQSDHIKIYVFALITNYALEISPATIDFGTVSTLETVRTEIRLTNHSLAAQEYAFLNLPRGVRVEPNMGFGWILPMESLNLHVLYSPGPEVLGPGPEKSGKHEFQIKVTSLAECGSFEETPPPEKGTESFESIWGEDYEMEEIEEEKEEQKTMTESRSDEHLGEAEDYGECYELDSSFEEEKMLERKASAEVKIRNYLKLDAEKISEHSFFKRINLKAPEAETSNETKEVPVEAVSDDSEEALTAEDRKPIFKPDMNTIRCEAVVTEPYCQLSDSVIQLPSTPCSSFSLYRFRVNGSNENSGTNCICLQRQTKVKNKFEAAFQFKYFCPQIKLEPQSGYLKAGQSVPITVIYRPEFPADDLCRESRSIKAKKLAAELAAKEVPAVSQPKGKRSPVKNQVNSADINDIINASLYELEKYDLFDGERSLQELISPFHLEVNISCVVKIDDSTGCKTTEIHDLLLVCPAVKPKFIYKGTSQEINFDKVFIGTRARSLVEIQNISFKRIFPVVSLVNPVGSFACPSGLRSVPVDPEHVLRYPLIYAPLNDGGIEKEYFEIHCGSTNICLLAKGEAVNPQYKITPNYGCCIIESKIGSAEELKLEIENLNPMKYQLTFVADYAKEGLDVIMDGKTEQSKDSKKEPPKGESRDKKKKTENEFKTFLGWEETPEMILNDLTRFEKVPVEQFSFVFNVIGLDDNGEVVVPPFGKSMVKIKFTPPIPKIEKADLVPTKKYAINYKIMLGGMAVLKEILIIGAISRVK